MSTDSVYGDLPEREWQPRTHQEHFECLDTAINKLISVASSAIPEIKDDLVAAGESLSLLLLDSTIRGRVASFFEATRNVYPETRETLRRIIAGVLQRERKYWKQLEPGEVAEIEKLHARFEGDSLGARLQQQVGGATWDHEEPLDLLPLANELLSNPVVLAEQWPWLTSGDASDGWRMGEALSQVDSEGKLAEMLPSLPESGADNRLICGYVDGRRRSQGDKWYEEWLGFQVSRKPIPIPLIFEVAWRVGLTEYTANSLARIIRAKEVKPQIVSQLAYGRWDQSIKVDAVEDILWALTEGGYGESALALLFQRMRSHPSEASYWKSLALKLITSAELIRGRQMTSYYWKEVAATLVGDYAQQIAAAIFREQASRDGGTWFVEYSDAADIIRAAVTQDPKGVWRAMQVYLSSPERASLFSIGFPRGLLEQMLPEDIEEWISEQPEDRSAMVANLVSKDFSTDETLPSRLLGKYGDNERVAGAFFSEYVSGVWSGPASIHWVELAKALEEVASRTKLPKLRSWANNSARSLRGDAERERQREEEEDLRGR